MHHRVKSWAPWMAALVTLAGGGTAGADKPLERFTAFAVDMGALRSRARTGTVDIAIERWSTDEERRRLMAAFKEDGRDGLLRALRDVKDRVGYVRSATSLGHPLRFAYQMPLASGGRRILIATDRRISFLEIRNQPRSLSYPFMIIEMRLDANGRGEGKLLPIADVTWSDEDVLVVENYDIQPVRLSQIRKAE